MMSLIHHRSKIVKDKSLPSGKQMKTLVSLAKMRTNLIAPQVVVQILLLQKNLLKRKENILIIQPREFFF